MAGKNKTEVRTKPCPFCNLGVASSHSGLISIIGDDKSEDRFKGPKLYCGRHFHKILMNVGASIKDMIYLKDHILKTDPNFHQALAYALTLSLMKEDEIFEISGKRKDTSAQKKEIRRSFVIESEKDLPGPSISIAITTSFFDEPLHLTPAEEIYKNSLITPGQVIDYAFKLGVALNMPKSLTWAKNLNDLKYFHVPYVPALANPPLNVDLIARFMVE